MNRNKPPFRRTALATAVFLAVISPVALSAAPSPILTGALNTFDGIPYVTRRSAAMNAAGESTVVWLEKGAIKGRRFDKAGTLGNVFGVSPNPPPAGVTYSAPVIAMDKSGAFVVAWISTTAPVDKTASPVVAILARRYDSKGVPLATEFVVPTTPMSGASGLSIALHPTNGAFLAAWDSAKGIVTARLVDANNASTSEISVDSGHNPAVAMDDSGDFVVVFEGYSTGNSVVIGHYTDDYGTQQENLWDETALVAQRFDSAGKAVGDTVIVQSDKRGDNTVGATRREVAVDNGSPVVVMEGDGDFVIAWENDTSATTTTTMPDICTGTGYDRNCEPQDDKITETESHAVYARRYKADGMAVARAGTLVSRNAQGPSISMDKTGDFAIGWESHISRQIVTPRHCEYGYCDGGETYLVEYSDVYAKKYKINPITGGFLLKSPLIKVTGKENRFEAENSVALDAGGDLVVTWFREGGTETSDGGVKVDALLAKIFPVK